jgi:hypothetical protein
MVDDLDNPVAIHRSNLSAFPIQVVGDGILYLQLVEFVNPEGLGSNGHCCDGKWGICQDNGCDHMFALCVDEVGG